MVKIERTLNPPASLAVEKLKTNGSCTEKDVVEQLESDFYAKCYICEQDELQSVEVEHLLPHHNGKYKERKFDWNNLFYSCAHCNSVKNQTVYETNVIDCCKTEPEFLVHQELCDGKVCVLPLKDTIEAKTTASLIEDCFELKNRPIREKESQVKFRALQTTMNTLYKELDKYKMENSKKSFYAIRGMLSREYKFAGFTRTYVRDHIDRYPDFEPYVRL